MSECLVLNMNTTSQQGKLNSSENIGYSGNKSTFVFLIISISKFTPNKIKEDIP